MNKTEVRDEVAHANWQAVNAEMQSQITESEYLRITPEAIKPIPC